MRLSHLGDAVGALPLFHALRAALPGARIAWAIEHEFADLVDGLPGLDSVIPFERARGVRGFLELRGRLRELAPQVAIDVQGNAKSHLVARASGARRRFAPNLRDCREPGLCRLVRCERPTPAPGRHARDRAAHLAAFVAERLGTGPLALEQDGLLPSVDELAAARARLAAEFADGPDLVFQLGREDDIRSWPADRCREWLQLASRRRLRVLVLAGPAEQQLGERLRAELPEEAGRRWRIGRRPLRELAAELTVAARAGAHFVGNDSGPTHLAAACGLPCILLAGPQDPDLTGPWPPTGSASIHRVARSSGELACRPCLRRTCGHERPRACLADLSAADVEAVYDSSRASSSATSR